MDRLNYGGIRVIVGAIDVETALIRYFDNAEHNLTFDAVMASPEQVRGFTWVTKTLIRMSYGTLPDVIAYAKAFHFGNPANNQPAQSPIGLNERVMPAQIQGTHSNVARFMSAVAKYPRIIYDRDFSITSLNRQESVNLTLVTYDAPTSGILPPIPAELRDEFQNQTAQLAPPVSPK